MLCRERVFFCRIRNNYHKDLCYKDTHFRNNNWNEYLYILLVLYHLNQILIMTESVLGIRREYRFLPLSLKTTFTITWWIFHCTSFMLCTAQLPGPVLKAFGWVQISPFQMADKSPMITDQLTAGGSVSQLSQLAKLSPWLTLSTKDITASFWHYKKIFCFLSNQIMGLYHFSNPIK